MKLIFLFGVLPVFVFFVKSLGDWKIGEARGPVIRIRKDSEHLLGVLEHELEHARQWYSLCLPILLIAIIAYFYGFVYWTLIVSLALCAHSLLYFASTKYRLWAEIRAYSVESKYSTGEFTEDFAHTISTRYGINISKERVIRLLQGK